MNIWVTDVLINLLDIVIYLSINCSMYISIPISHIRIKVTFSVTSAYICISLGAAQRQKANVHTRLLAQEY